MVNLIEALRCRAALYQDIRHFFFKRAVLEVDTPILSFAANPDPALLSFITPYHGPGPRFNQDFYLNTSPEFCMKRLLAAGSGSIYSLCKVFRDGECGLRHNPEFTMLEWYHLGYSLADLMEESIALIQYLYIKRQPNAPSLKVKKISYRHLFLELIQLDPMTASIEMLQSCLATYHIDLHFIPEDKDEYLDLIVSHIIEPKIDPQILTLVYHYPASQAALATTMIESDCLVGERVEIYWKGLELANGFHELTHSVEQGHRFMQNNQMRMRRGMPPLKIDTEFLACLDAMPNCSGIAFGVDRILMCLLGTDNISDVLSFDFNHA